MNPKIAAIAIEDEDCKHSTPPPSRAQTDNAEIPENHSQPEKESFFKRRRLLHDSNVTHVNEEERGRRQYEQAFKGEIKNYFSLIDNGDFENAVHFSTVHSSQFS